MLLFNIFSILFFIVAKGRSRKTYIRVSFRGSLTSNDIGEEAVVLNLIESFVCFFIRGGKGGRREGGREGGRERKREREGNYTSHSIRYSS